MSARDKSPNGAVCAEKVYLQRIDSNKQCEYAFPTPKIMLMNSRGTRWTRTRVVALSRSSHTSSYAISQSSGSSVRVGGRSM